ncbi:MAG: amidophosphoribosyltransferase [Bacteroidetes bacterium]|uniref:Amidophosphoribosyltransferase n=1 Tax=Candidatus Enterocola intestinipullorum TaxID=2840783 RepID=A0A9D9EIG4_9BACT|nr:amidophosphoribosyltransferase [Candidatus Enterocola intestinipullorum]
MELLKHECGVAMIRLRKPLEYYKEKYGTWMYGLNKLYLLMEKQHNRGQEGAGMACVKLDMPAGTEFMFRERAEGSGAISELFNTAHSQIARLPVDKRDDAAYAKEHAAFAGEIYMGHLRYSTTGKSGLSYVHPFMRRHNYLTNNLLLCGNFNLTNVDEVFEMIVRQGQHPRHYADTFIILEQIGHRLDREVDSLYDKAQKEYVPKDEVKDYIQRNIRVENVLKECSPVWDGGYVICGITGSGESFALRDPWGIRPAFYYIDDEIIVLASERPVIQTALAVETESVKELQPGESLIVSQNGDYRVVRILPALNRKACSFERIYFSRGSDRDIYKERKALGNKLVPDILKSIDYDIAHSVFSYIPNTAEVAFFGMVHGLNAYLNNVKSEAIRKNEGRLTPEFLSDLLSTSVRTEKVAIKDIKLRTFISEGNSRNELAAHVYDISYGSLRAGEDNLVIIDDSIVRGTTLKQSIIRILARLNPKKIVIVSSAPQIRYPDFYGIDMPSLEEFIAFKAAVALLHENGMENILHEVYEKSKSQQNQPKEWIVNYVKEIYKPFTAKQISQKMEQLLTPSDVKCPVEILYQSVEGLHEACPDHSGDWYFTGDYPTPGGNKLVNFAYIRYYEKFILGK